MTQIAGTTDTFDGVGIREDLSDIIYDISPMDTPFMTSIGRDKPATNTFHEWQTDALAAAATNRQIEGDDASFSTAVATTRVGNYTQIARKTVLISRTYDKVGKAGRRAELSYQIMKQGKELKRDMEFALVRNQASSAGGSQTARSSAGVESWIKTNRTLAGGAANTTGTTPGFASGTVAAPTDGTVATLTKATLDSALSAAWTQGGDVDTIMSLTYQKSLMNAFTGIATPFVDVKTRSPADIIGSAAYYVSDFGTHKLVLNRFMRDRTVLCLDTEYWAVSFLDPIKAVPLAKTGDAEKHMLIAEFCLVSKNEAASSKVSDCATS